MKISRAVASLFVMVAVFGFVSCCPEQSSSPPSNPSTNQGVEDQSLKMSTSKFVLLTPEVGNPGACILEPEELHMGNQGIKWVTFVNHTAVEMVVKFDEEDTIGDVDSYTINANEAGSFKLKNPNTNKSHTYTVAADCYEAPVARPKIIIP